MSMSQLLAVWSLYNGSVLPSSLPGQLYIQTDPVLITTAFHTVEKSPLKASRGTNNFACFCLLSSEPIRLLLLQEF